MTAPSISTERSSHSCKSKFYRRRTQKRVENVKKRARSELNSCGWSPHQYANSGLVNKLQQFTHDNIERVDGREITIEEFQERFEKRSVPVILTGIIDHWDANKKWTLDRLYKKYRNQKFKCGEDDDGYSVKLKMKYYMDYMTSTTDDSPLYIFDSGFGDRKKSEALLKDYEVPNFFADDLFGYATDQRRPPYRWIVIGPERSGTAIHVDPLGTSAWNALISGEKKWCLIHPSAPKSYVKPRKDEVGKHPDEAVTWFQTVFPRVAHDNLYPTVYATQRAGDVMFVPSGWWHVVINTETAIAITQNFCSSVNLPEVWKQTTKGRPQFAKHWLRHLKQKRPEVVDRIVQLDQSYDWLAISDDVSSDSSSSSSSESDSDSEDSGTETEESKRKRPHENGTSTLGATGLEPCPSKLRKNLND
ncbi:unnamed protein product [Bursaphelenchus okinawaensis]|uniref:JmjC domain-containing protein n=1 Tax=Bursaphelenchus okinawaensis TaxID=465554 RepID=A0A811KV21_9BILA|nr:unnamed protein product [Bursaphelenchus okinawaensis]CAG9112740.1 unnamed protein product [Bursaphelenchus okinawaensis]